MLVSKEIKKHILKAVSEFGKKKITGSDIVLEFPENEVFGDYTTNFAMRFWKEPKDASSFLANIERFWQEVKKDNFSQLDMVLPVGQLSVSVAKTLFAADPEVWLRSSAFAKIRGWRKSEGFTGHPEISREYFWAIPSILAYPEHIIKDKGEKGRYLLVGRLEKLFSLVVEIGILGKKNWLVTAFITKERYLRKREADCLEHKKTGMPAGTAISPILVSDLRRSGGSRFSTLQDTQDFYNKLKKESQGVFSLEYPLFRSPYEFAESLVTNLQKDKSLAKVVSKIEVAGPGFVNFWLSEKFIIDQSSEINRETGNHGRSEFLKNKSFLIEHTSPNIIKTLHVGHVRNNVLGMFLGRLFGFLGAKVKLDCINNDRGIHIMKAIWAYQKYGQGKTPESENLKPDHFVNQFYVMGVKEEENPAVKEEMQELLRQWEAGDKEIRAVWQKLTGWVHQGFKETYKRLGSHHDKNWHESQFYEKGRKLVLEGVKKGIFKKLEDGAILSNLEKYKLPDTILLRTDGTTMYHTQDLWLTKLKREYLKADKYFWVVGPEQSLYLKQLYSMAEQFGIGKKEDYEHIAYGYVFLKGKGKMSSRAGTVVSADELLDSAIVKALEMMNSAGVAKNLSKEEKEKIAEAVGIGAVKYAMLKHGRLSDIQFDFEETVGLEGNSGPYIQYVYARCRSVIRSAKRKAQSVKPQLKTQSYEPNDEELAILRWLARFPEVLIKSAEQMAPNLLCNYLFELCQKFNLFYQKHRILGEPEEQFRLTLTMAASQTIKNSLWLLGIEAPEKM